MGMFGILVMIGENELSSAGVYTKVGKIIYIVAGNVHSFTKVRGRITYCQPPKKLA